MARLRGVDGVVPPVLADGERRGPGGGAGGEVMARREDLVEALDAIETGMCRVKESRDIWQDELVYALCQGVRLLLTEEVKHGRQ